MSLTADELAQEIRSAIAGRYALGPVELAEALFPFIERHIAAWQQGVTGDAQELASAMEFESAALIALRGRLPESSDARLLSEGAKMIRRLATSQPPKPAGAVSLPEPEAVGAHIVGWVHEDQLPDGYPYDAMFPHSRVDGVRMFPVFAPTPAADAGGVTVTEEMVERVWMAATGRTRLGKGWENDAKCMTAEERADTRAALTAALTPEVRHGE